jgi:hypothetical protein
MPPYQGFALIEAGADLRGRAGQSLPMQNSDAYPHSKCCLHYER